MLIDSRLEFSIAQVLAASGVSTNVIDLSQDRNIGRGRPMWVVLQITQAPDSANADETYQADLQTDDTDAFGSPTVIGTVTIPRTALLGARFWIALGPDNEQFLRMNYTLGGTTPSIGLSAWLTDQEPESWESHDDAI